MYELSSEEKIKIAAEELLLRRKARASFRDFTAYCYPSFVCAPHHKLIIDKLEDVIAGRTKRLMVFMPPRHGKSLLISQHLPAYIIGKDPTKRVVMASYEEALAKDFGQYCRNLIFDQRYKNIFPHVQIAQDSRAAGKWNTSEGGGFKAGGIKTGLTGRGAHCAIIDDPCKDRQSADSEAAQKFVQGWWQSTFYTRLAPNASVIIVMTRWHWQDLSGWLLENDKNHEWDVLCLPALAEENDPLGRLPGEALWPEMFPKEKLIEMRDDPTKVGPREFASLYQQRPTVAEGSIFKIAGLKRWTQTNIPRFFESECISMDTNVSEGAKADYTVIQHWGKSGAYFYLLDQVKGQWGMTQQLNAFRIFCDTRPWVAAKLVEKKANGAAIIDMLSRWISGLVPVEPLGSKEQRAMSVEPYVTQGNVYVPETSVADWVEDYILELSQFPSGKHDDQVDCTSQALNWLARNGQQMAEISNDMLFAFGGRG